MIEYGGEIQFHVWSTKEILFYHPWTWTCWFEEKKFSQICLFFNFYCILFEKQRSQTLLGVGTVRNHLNEDCCFSLLMLLSMKNRMKICGPMRVNRFWCGKRHSLKVFHLFHLCLKAPARLGLWHSPLTQKCLNSSQVSQLLISSFSSDFFH